jgi:hypothetical protein
MHAIFTQTNSRSCTATPFHTVRTLLPPEVGCVLDRLRSALEGGHGGPVQTRFACVINPRQQVMSKISSSRFCSSLEIGTHAHHPRLVPY